MFTTTFKMKVLVCGSSGLVGSDLCSLLEEEQISYVGIHNTRPRNQSYKVNILNQTEFASFLDEHQPTVCVNCIAERNVDTCEVNWDQTKKVNVDIVSSLAKECAQRNIYFLHLSTDYVFDGRAPPYLPTSQVNPLQNYGISKFLAECRVKTYLEDACIVRVPVLYTNTYSTLSETAVTVLAKKVMNQVESTNEDNYSIRRPVFIPDFCKFLLHCILEKKTGTYHFYNNETKITKYNMCKMIGQFLQMPSDHIQPVNTPPSNDAGRPYDTRFSDPQYTINDFQSVPLAGGMALCLNKFWHPRVTDPKIITDHMFFLLDLDGTLLDTDRLHYDCYQKVLAEYQIPLDWITYRKFPILDEGLRKLIGNDTLFAEIKAKKRALLQTTQTLELIPGARELIDHFVDWNIQFAVVTNTGKETVDHFKSVCPLLQKIQNWVVREDYREPKPNPECYMLAIAKFYRNQKYIVGIENTLTGFKALQSITTRIYIVTSKDDVDYAALKKEDCYLVNDLVSLYTSDAR